MIHAWLAFDAECRGCHPENSVVQRPLVADTRPALVRQANAVLAAMGVPEVEGRRFDVTVWDYPYTIDLGAGIEAALYPCTSEGVNIPQAREPRGE